MIDRFNRLQVIAPVQQTKSIPIGKKCDLKKILLLSHFIRRLCHKKPVCVYIGFWSLIKTAHHEKALLNDLRSLNFVFDEGAPPISTSSSNLWLIINFSDFISSISNYLFICLLCFEMNRLSVFFFFFFEKMTDSTDLQRII